MDSISMANSGITSNSTTSEGCCAAVQAACEILVERLTPTFQMLQAGAPDSEVKWDTLISKVRYQRLLSSVELLFTLKYTCANACCLVLKYSTCNAGNVYD